MRVLAALFAILAPLLFYGCDSDPVVKPVCADFTKPAAVTDDATCETACVTGEGLVRGSWKADKLACDCKVTASGNDYRTICEGEAAATGNSTAGNSTRRLEELLA